jgi:hypothetical protein
MCCYRRYIWGFRCWDASSLSTLALHRAPFKSQRKTEPLPTGSSSPPAPAICRTQRPRGITTNPDPRLAGCGPFVCRRGLARRLPSTGTTLASFCIQRVCGLPVGSFLYPDELSLDQLYYVVVGTSAVSGGGLSQVSQQAISASSLFPVSKKSSAQCAGTGEMQVN